MTDNPAGAWLAKAIVAVETSIDELLRAFVQHPYAHRVEHSLHVDLYQLMRAHAALADEVEIGKSGFSTRLIHKEWPSNATFSLRGAKERRQSYDLAVLDPFTLSGASLQDFSSGRLQPPIAIELGLDYSLGHLSGDLDKLRRNVVPHAYVVHFSRRITRTASQVEDAVLAADPVRSAFAHLLPSGEIRWKRLGDTEVHVRARA